MAIDGFANASKHFDKNHPCALAHLKREKTTPESVAHSPDRESITEWLRDHSMLGIALFHLRWQW
jgi:hypothetical protein